MVLAYHVVISTYGFWLPNDPRGAWSDHVWGRELKKHGPSTKITERLSTAHASHDEAKRRLAKSSLKRPAVVFTGRQALAVAHGFADCVARHELVLHACAILPSHVHVVAKAHERGFEWIAGELKRSATFSLIKEKQHPFESQRDLDGHIPSCWGRGQWGVFLNSREAVEHAVGYADENPVKEGKPRQNWSFVRRWDWEKLA